MDGHHLPRPAPLGAATHMSLTSRAVHLGGCILTPVWGVSFHPEAYCSVGNLSDALCSAVISSWSPRPGWDRGRGTELLMSSEVSYPVIDHFI